MTNIPQVLYRLYVGTGRQLPDHFRLPSPDDNPHRKGEPNLDSIEAAIVLSLDARDISGATLIRATGVWCGATEPTTVVELVDFDGSVGDKVGGLARSLRDKFGQDAVLVVSNEVHASIL